MNVRMARWALMAMAGSAVAIAADAGTEDLKAQIDALQKKIDALEARQMSAASTDAVVERMFADAQKRSQLMSTEGFTAGYNRGKFVIQSADGNFSFSPSAQLHARYAGNWQEEDAEGDSSYTDGFEIRRAKFGFNGNIGSPSLTYKFVWATDRAGKGVNLEEAWARYRFENGLFIFGGQFEDLTSHESLVSSSKQLAAEQSLANRALIDAYSEFTQGAGIGYETARSRVSAAFTDGWGSNNTNYEDHAFDGSTVYWGASARGELLVMGDGWKAYEDFSAIGNKSDTTLLALGAGASYAEGENFNGVAFAVDAQWEPAAVAGLGVYGAVLGNNIDSNGGGDDETDWGLVLQAGYMLTGKHEVFGRYDQIRDDATEDTYSEFTVGMNYYLYGHNAKFTVDLGYLPDGAPDSQSGLAIQQSDDAQLVGRAQFQLSL